MVRLELWRDFYDGSGFVGVKEKEDDRVSELRDSDIVFFKFWIY